MRPARVSDRTGARGSFRDPASVVASHPSSASVPQQLSLGKRRHWALACRPDPSGEGALRNEGLERAQALRFCSRRDDVQRDRGGEGVGEDRRCKRSRGGEIVAERFDEPTSMVGEGVDQVGIVDVFDRDPGLGDNHQRQFFDRGHTAWRNAEGRDHDEMRSGHGIPQGDLPLEASRHAAMQVLAEQEGVLRQVLDDELVAMAGAAQTP